MKGAFDLFQEIGDAVGVETRAAASETSGSNAEGRTLRRAVRHQAAAQSVVDDLAKGAAGPPALGLQLRRDVIVQRQGGAHIMMISIRHHDVKTRIRPDEKRPATTGVASLKDLDGPHRYTRAARSIKSWNSSRAFSQGAHAVPDGRIVIVTDLRGLLPLLSA